MAFLRFTSAILLISNDLNVNRLPEIRREEFGAPEASYTTKLGNANTSSEVTSHLHTQPPLDMKSLERKLPEISFNTIDDLVQFDCSLFLGSEDSEKMETAFVSITKIEKKFKGL